MSFIGKYVGNHRVGYMMYNFNTTPDTDKDITDSYIQHHAQILRDLGGKKKTAEYVAILTPYRDNQLKFDAVFSRLREEIFLAYK